MLTGLLRFAYATFNDSGDDPGLSRTVGSGDTADTAHTVRLPDVLLCRSFPVIREIII